MQSVPFRKRNVELYEKETVGTDNGVLVDHSLVHLNVLAGFVAQNFGKKTNLHLLECSAVATSFPGVDASFSDP